MKKKKCLLSAIILCCFFMFTHAQRGEHLIPIEGYFDLAEYRHEYYKKVKDILFKGLSDSYTARIQTMPSFSQENVLSLEIDYETDQYSMVYHIGSESIWYSKSPENIKVNRYKKEVDKNTADLITALFEAAVMKTHYPKKENLGLDGTNYYFSVEGGYKSGRVWSPPKKSKMQRLVSICNELIQLIYSESGSLEIDTDLKNKISTLTKELK